MRWWVLRNNLHVSWQVAIVCVGIVGGITLSRLVSGGWFESILWLFTALILIGISLIRPKYMLISTALLGGILLGLWRGTTEHTALTGYKGIIGQSVAVRGVVADDIDKNARNQTIIRLKDVHFGNQSVPGSAWVTTNIHQSIRRSDIVFLRGKIGDGFGNFAFTMYSARLEKVQRPVPGDRALAVRDAFSKGVEKALPEPQSSLGLGYLVGQRRGLPIELDTALKFAGLTHIVVASGYNLTILVRLARRLFERVSKYLSAVTASSMIVGFIAITGLSPSMSRAGLVAGISLLAWYYGRRVHPLVLLPLAMAITALWQPSYVWGDLGWQLSFAAFAGVLIVAPLITAYFFGEAPEKPLRRILIETISAQLVTAPIVIGAFGQISIIAPLSNIFILPLVPLAMLLTAVAGSAGLVLPSVASIIGLPANVVLTYMVHLAEYAGGLSWATAKITIPIWSIWCMYGALIVACLYAARKTKHTLQNVNVVE